METSSIVAVAEAALVITTATVVVEEVEDLHQILMDPGTDMRVVLLAAAMEPGPAPQLPVQVRAVTTTWGSAALELQVDRPSALKPGLAITTTAHPAELVC